MEQLQPMQSLGDDLVHDTLLPFLTWSEAMCLTLTCRQYHVWCSRYTPDSEQFSHEAYMAKRFGTPRQHPLVTYRWLLFNTPAWHHSLRNAVILQQYYGNHGRRQLRYDVCFGGSTYRIHFYLPGHSSTNLPPHVMPKGVRILNTSATCTDFMMESPTFSKLIYHWMRKLYIREPNVILLTT